MAKVHGFDHDGFQRAVKVIHRVEESTRNSREDYWPDTGADDGSFDDYVLVTGPVNVDGWYPGVTQVRGADEDVWNDINGETVYIRGINNGSLGVNTRYKGTISGGYTDPDDNDAVGYETDADSGGLTVLELDGSPLVTGVNRIVLDQSTGIFLSNALTVSGATNTYPIQITTTTPHGYQNDDTPTITGVTGNTAANVSGVPITVINTTSFSLDDTAASGVYTGGGQVTLPGEARIAITQGTAGEQHGFPWTRAKSTLPFPVTVPDSHGVSFRYGAAFDQEYSDLHPGCMIRGFGLGFTPVQAGNVLVAFPYMWHKATHLTALGQALNAQGGGNLVIAHIGLYDNLVPASLNYFYPGNLLAGGLVSTQPDEEIIVGVGGVGLSIKLLSIAVDVEPDRVYWFVTYLTQNAGGILATPENDLEPIYGLKFVVNPGGSFQPVCFYGGVGVYVQGYSAGFLPTTFPKNNPSFPSVDMLPANTTGFVTRPIVLYRKGN